MTRNDHCPICSETRWNKKFSFPGFDLLESPRCGLIKTHVTAARLNSPGSELYESKDEVEKHFHLQKEEFEHYARQIVNQLPSSSGKLLDVGCGFGWVVAEAQRKGFMATGIDPSQTYSAAGRKFLAVNLKTTSLEKFQPKEKFDIIVLNHVLEHITSPDKFLQRIHTLLKRSGVLLVACPNIRSLMFLLFKKRWYGLQPGQHFWQFTPKSLGQLISQQKFELISTSTKPLGYKLSSWKGLVFWLINSVGTATGTADQVYILANK